MKTSFWLWITESQSGLVWKRCSKSSHSSPAWLPKTPVRVLSSLSCPSSADLLLCDALSATSLQLMHSQHAEFSQCSHPHAPGNHCAGGKICSHRTGLLCVFLSSQSADDLIAWENVPFNLLELVISSSLISLYFWLERLKILIYQWHL